MWLFPSFFFVCQKRHADFCFLCIAKNNLKKHKKASMLDYIAVKRDNVMNEPHAIHYF